MTDKEELRNLADRCKMWAIRDSKKPNMPPAEEHDFWKAHVALTMLLDERETARPSPAAHRAKVEAEIQDAWERESLSDLCLIARRLLWAA